MCECLSFGFVEKSLGSRIEITGELFADDFDTIFFFFFLNPQTLACFYPRIIENRCTEEPTQLSREPKEFIA